MTSLSYNEYIEVECSAQGAFSTISAYGFRTTTLLELHDAPFRVPAASVTHVLLAGIQ